MCGHSYRTEPDIRNEQAMMSYGLIHHDKRMFSSSSTELSHVSCELIPASTLLWISVCNISGSLGKAKIETHGL